MAKKILNTPESVTGKVSVWAIPQTDWVDGSQRFTGKWEYEVSTGYPWQVGAVKIHTQEITLLIPNQVDIVQQAIHTIEDKIEEARAEYHHKITELQGQLNSLRALTYNPEHNGDILQEESETHARVRTYTDPADGANVIDLGVASVHHTQDDDDIPF